MSEPASLAPGTRLGRYFVLGRIASGGYGDVLRAYDPQLDRKVALKLLRPDRTPAGTGRAALLHEAQALAKLAHPAVVAVYEVFDSDDRTVLAMELVDGVELGAWLGAGRSWRDALAVVLAAGSGLVAAHAAGIVHGDFKPANVLVDVDARARVVDFGLADIAAHDDVSSAGDPGGFTSGAATTDSGARPAGTLRYMAPELLAGARPSAATDQYAFFVTLYEAIFGVAALRERQDAMRERGGLLALPPRPRVPSWLRRALARGLAGDPQRRPGSLADALAELERGGRRRRSGAALALAGAALGAGVLAVTMASADERACDRAVELAVDSWDPQHRDQVEAALRRASPLLAESTYAAVDRELGRYLEQWGAQYRTSCVALASVAEHAALSDPVLRCLRRQHVVVAAWVDALARPSVTTIERAVPAIAALPRPASCLAEASREGFAPPLDPALAGEVEALRRAIEHTATVAQTGDARGALLESHALLERAQALGEPPAVAEALRLQGSLRAQTGDPVGARRDLEDALWRAEAVAHDALVVRAAIDLTATIGVSLEQPAEARVFARHGQAMLERGPPDAALTSEMLARTAEVDALDQRFDDAELALHRALALATEVYGPDHLALADLWIDLGNVATARGAFDDAEPSLQRGLAIRRAWLPPHHPVLASALHNVAVLAHQRGRWAEARTSLQEVLELERAALGEHHPKLAITLSNLAAAELALEDYDDAELHTRAALDILARTVGSEHPNFGLVQVNLGQIRFAIGDADGALELTRAGIAQLERARSPEHASLVQPLLDLVMIHRERGELDQAFAALERARGIDLGGDEDDDTLWAWYVLQRADLDAHAGAHVDAIAGYQTALDAMTHEHEPDALERHEVELGLGLALHAEGDLAQAQRWAIAAAAASVGSDHALVAARAEGLLADLARERGDLEATLEHQRGVLEALAPEQLGDGVDVSVLAHLALARGLWRRGRHRDARAQLETALRTCTDDEACIRARSWAATHAAAPSEH